MKTIDYNDILNRAINDWYFEHGMEVPNWQEEDPQWWIDYLNELENE